MKVFFVGPTARNTAINALRHRLEEAGHDVTLMLGGFNAKQVTNALCTEEHKVIVCVDTSRPGLVKLLNSQNKACGFYETIEISIAFPIQDNTALADHLDRAYAGICWKIDALNRRLTILN